MKMLNYLKKCQLHKLQPGAKTVLMKINFDVSICGIM